MSRYLSYLLINAVKEGIPIDSQGYMSVSIILDLLSAKRTNITTLEQLNKLVYSDIKKRFSIIKRNNEYFIRANQSYSINMVTEEYLIPIIDAKLFPIVIHGSTRDDLISILLDGLSRISYSHIRFAQSQSAENALRNNSTVFIYIDLDKALTDGLKFFVSETGLILTPGNQEGILEPKYFKLVIDENGNDLLSPPEPTIPRAGCIVFRNTASDLQVWLIAYHKGVYGFPKGKLEKSEQLIPGALRELEELEEETGITVNKIAPLDETKFVDESAMNNIRLFITTLIVTEIKLDPIDVKEIALCQFISVDKALQLLSVKYSIEITTLIYVTI